MTGLHSEAKIQRSLLSNTGGVSFLIPNMARVQNPRTFELGTQRLGHVLRLNAVPNIIFPAESKAIFFQGPCCAPK